MNGNKFVNKLARLILLAAGIGAFFFLDLSHYFSLNLIKSSQQTFVAYYLAYPLAALAMYFVIYEVICTLSVPCAVVVTLSGGALFGLPVGTPLVSVVSKRGATLEFLSCHIICWYE
jgi:uncharacterized membrane protein YdjX (TVP38/TMEM64 family)